MTTLIDRITNALASTGSWMKLDELLTAMGESPEDKSASRQVRACIAASPNLVISNSTNGYRLLATAADTEVDHAIADYRSRSANLERRARAVETAACLLRASRLPKPAKVDDETLWN